MDLFISVLKVILEEGLMYAILAIGVYISYSILDFPDLTVDGSMPFGAILTAIAIINGVNPWLALIISFVFGCLAGTVTGLLHVKFKIKPLLCGILVSTALISVNLVVLLELNSGITTATFFNMDTIFKSGIATLIPNDIFGYNFRVAIMSAIIVIIVKVIFDIYLKTKSGLLIRATGNNEKYVAMLGQDPGTSKIIGLALGNGFAALSGGIIAQSKGSADTTMGTGMVVLGLASVIIGISLFKKVKFMKATTMVILGSILYKACLAIALNMGLPTEYLKMLMVVIFIFALVGSEKFSFLSKRRA